MPGKTQVSLEEFRSDMRALGLTVRTTTTSAFKTATVCDAGTPINRGDIVSAAHRQKYTTFFAYRQQHSVRDGLWTVVF